MNAVLPVPAEIVEDGDVIASVRVSDDGEILIGSGGPVGTEDVALSWHQADALAEMLEAASRRARELWKAAGRCTFCGGSLEEGDEGPECDPTGCPGRHGG